MADTVNSQITDFVAPGSEPTIETPELFNLRVLGVARSQALAVAYQGLAQSLSMLMQNAVAAQQAAATVNTAIVSLTVKRLMSGQPTQTQLPQENENA
jgi:hypothetical protein